MSSFFAKWAIAFWKWSGARRGAIAMARSKSAIATSNRSSASDAWARATSASTRSGRYVTARS